MLVERRWPRGLTKEKAAIAHWMKAIAPSSELRRWFGHDPDRWTDFRHRYVEELRQHTALLDQIRDLAREGTVTLLFGTHSEERNNVAVLREVLVKGMSARRVKSGMSLLHIEVKPPFRLDLTVWALRRRPMNQIDRWDGTTYHRAIFVGDAPVELRVTQVGDVERPRLQVAVAGLASRDSQNILYQVLNRVLGLDIDLAPFYEIAAHDARLNDLAIRFRGMRPPRFPTIFEALLNGVSCQQLSLEAGLTLLNRLVATHGQAPQPRLGAENAFPQPADLARTTVESLRALGYSNSKGAAIIGIASAVDRQEVRLDQFNELGDDGLQARLDQLRGVGRWTAEYVLLRGYGRLNVFPGDDVGARNSLQRWLGRRQSLDYERTKKLLRRWQPYAGLLYFHLLLKNLEEKGLIEGRKGRAQDSV